MKTQSDGELALATIVGALGQTLRQLGTTDDEHAAATFFSSHGRIHRYPSGPWTG